MQKLVLGRIKKVCAFFVPVARLIAKLAKSATIVPKHSFQQLNFEKSWFFAHFKFFEKVA